MPGPAFTDAQKQTSLEALALANGNVKKAAAMLRASGEPVSERALRDWRATEQYERIVETRERWVTDLLANQSEYIAGRAGEQEMRFLESLAQMDDESLQTLSAATRSQITEKLSAIRRRSIETGRLLRDKPTHINQTQTDPVQALRKLQEMGIVRVAPALLESTAREEPQSLEPGEVREGT